MSRLDQIRRIIFRLLRYFIWSKICVQLRNISSIARLTLMILFWYLNNMLIPNLTLTLRHHCLHIVLEEVVVMDFLKADLGLIFRP